MGWCRCKEGESLHHLPKPGTGGEHGGGKWFSGDHTITESWCRCQVNSPAPSSPLADKQIRIDQTPLTLLPPPGGSLFWRCCGGSRQWNAGRQLGLRCWIGWFLEQKQSCQRQKLMLTYIAKATNHLSSCMHRCFIQCTTGPQGL